jgi:hypothetical protein
MLGYSIGLNITSDYINAIEKTQNLAKHSPLPDCFAYSVFCILNTILTCHTGETAGTKSMEDLFIQLAMH